MRLGNDKMFVGSIPQVYDQYLVPLIFESYAADLAVRVARRQPSRVLEIAAGTGAVTRQMAEVLPASASILATDLHQPMLDQAAAVGTTRPVEWQRADAMQLPFEDGQFDTVVCQFGVMFFPDKVRAFSEARRVLRPGGCLMFSVWDHIEHNEFADVVTQALETVFPDDPPQFAARVPHGYYDASVITRDLAQAGFAQSPEVVTRADRSRAESPQVPGVAYCQGTPLRNEIEARDPQRLLEATEAASAAIAERFGTGAVDGKIQAHIFSVEH